MKKTLTVEVFLTVLLILLGILGDIFAPWRFWLMTGLIAVILLAYLVRWQFIIPAAILIPVVTKFILNPEVSLGLFVPAVLFVTVGMTIYFSYGKGKLHSHKSLVLGLILGLLLYFIVLILLGEYQGNSVFDFILNYIVSNIKSFAFILAFVPLIVVLVFEKIFKTGKR